MFFPNIFKDRNELNQYWFNDIHQHNQSQFVQNRTNFILGNEEFFSKKDYSGEKTFLLWSSLSNTIPTLFWSLVHLLNDENLFQIIEKEIEENLSKDFLFDCRIETCKLRSCKYLDSFINEILRIYSNPMIQRKASKDIQLKLHNGKQIFIKKKSLIAFYPQIAHNDIKYFPNADQFQFDRFVNEKVENIPGYLPFGSGQSMCPGRFFAKNIIQLSIISFLQFLSINFDHRVSIPMVNQQRQGIGLSHPRNDITFSFKFK